MAKKFVNLDNLEHVIEKHDRDVQGLNDALQRIDAKVDKVIFGEVGGDAAVFSLRRDTGADIDSKYNPEKDGEAEAGVYLDDSGDVPTYRFAFKIPQGKQGIQGEQGVQGEQGIQGEKGEVGDPYYNRYVMAFCHVGYNHMPPALSDIEGYWTPTEDKVEVYDPNGVFQWSLEDESMEPPVWMSNGYVVKDIADDPNNPIRIKWNTPIQLTGDKGENGVDGAKIEFIYKRTKTSLETPSIPDNHPSEVDYIPEGWNDHPNGVDEEYQCEWMCSRKRYDNGLWGEWNEKLVDGKYVPGEPVIFSKWGDRGIDGDGVQYIYKTNKGSLLDNPTPTDYETNADYQDKYGEYIPDGWSDDPTGTSESNPYEWVCVRKYKGIDQKWGPFEGPKLWANWSKDGSNGVPGVRYEARYYKVSGSSQFPDAAKPSDKMNIILPTGWQRSVPSYTSGNDTIWVTYAYVNYKNEMATTADGLDADVCGWSEPALFSAKNGIDGKDGKDGIDGVGAVPPNYKTYVYKQSDTKPSKPTSNDPKNPGNGWEDIPTTEGQWWQCIGSVNGVTELVTEWSEVIPVNGKDGKDGKDGEDGVAQDGKHIEMRFGVGLSAPSISKSSRNPGSGWSTQPATPSENQHLWMIMATINPNDTMEGEWSTPVRISGEQGPKGDTGPTGPQGPGGVNGSDGLPGVSFESQYCLGTETAADGSWQDTVPTITVEKQYIWMRQGKRVYSSASDKTGTVNWGAAFRLSGLNGVSSDGEARKGQIVYPAGIYNVNTTYETTDRTAPYVMDPEDGEFYVLDYVGKWLGTKQNNRTPYQDYKDNGGQYWQKFESFEAVYAKVGIIANGLIGSAVFNNEFMFSQQGITANGAASSDYHKFNASDPYKSTNEFRPNFCVNFETGEVWTSAGKNYFAADGSGHLANKHIEWGASGGLMMDGALKHKWADITTPEDPNASTYRFIIPNNDLYKVGGGYVPKYNNYKIFSSSTRKNMISLPTNPNWDGTELTIMNNGNADLYLGNALITDSEMSKGEISSYGDAVTPSGLSYAIGAGTIIQLIGVTGHPFQTSQSASDVSWFTTSNAAAKYMRAIPLYIQFWNNDTGSIGPYYRDFYDSSLFNADVCICHYLSESDSEQGIPHKVIQPVTPTNYLFAGYQNSPTFDPTTGVNYIAGAPRDKLAAYKTLCAQWYNLTTDDCAWLFEDSTWNSTTGVTYLEIYVKDERIQGGDTRKLTFDTSKVLGGQQCSGIWLRNYATNEQGKDYEDIYKFYFTRTNYAPYFISHGDNGTGGTYWFRYRLNLKDIKSLLSGGGLNSNPTPLSFATAFNSKWDNEANGGSWVYSANAGAGASALSIVGKFFDQDNITMERQ